MALVMGIADRVHVLDFGRTIASGSPREVQESPAVDRGVPRSARLTAPLLELEQVHARYGEVRALHGVSLAVEEGQIVSVLGPNGAGKTTTLRAVSGTVRTSGSIVYAGKRIGRSPEGAARAGIAHVPEGRGTFAELTVWENLRLGAYTVRAARLRRRACVLPVARRAAAAAGGHAERRRAADARARARARLAPAAPAPRRAVARPRAARRPRDLRRSCGG